MMPASDVRMLVSQLDREEKDATAMIDAVANERLAQMEALLAAKYEQTDARWERIATRVHEVDQRLEAEYERLINEANTEVQQILAEEDVPPSFAPRWYKPSLPMQWANRGETADKERRTELRRVGASRIKADKAHAIVEQRVAYTKVRRQIISGALTSREARRLLEAIPTAQDLLPPVKIEELEAAVPLLPPRSY